MSELLAKSGKDGSARTLIEHTVDVVEAFGALFGTVEMPTRLALRWCEFFRVEDVAGFIRNGLVACWTHDWGKANDGFQATLLRKGSQSVRHEHLSAMLLELPCFREWLEAMPGIDREVVVAAVMTHHLKADYEEFGLSQAEPDSLIEVGKHEDFRKLVELAAENLKIPLSDGWRVHGGWCFEPQEGDFDASSHLKGIKESLSDFDDELRDEGPRRRLLWAVRAGLIAADSAGSGLVREKHGVGEWIRDAFESRPPMTGDYVREKVIEPREQQLKASGHWRGWSDFQLACDDLPARSLLLAPCGSGKTLGAWRWIAAQLDRKPASRVLFLYPTKGTATEGFRDYVSWAPESDAALVHGSARYDLEELFEDVGDVRGEKSFESNERLFALKQWSKRIFSATVDQFVAFLQYGYGPVCQLPLLVDSVIVVDEVHSFDRRMFGALLDFLKAFPSVPVLCMTATLTADRRKDIEDAELAVYPKEMPQNLKDSAEYRRYVIRRTTREGAMERVSQALKEKKRVLWVVNNVKRAQILAKEFAKAPEADQLETAERVPMFCYHSRFTLEDRRTQHGAVVGAFRRQNGGERQGAVLAITTQVCEMSLDLDADIVVMEEAPISAMIQRKGRCCRQWPIVNGRTGEVWIYSPEKETTYKPEQMKGVSEFVETVTKLETASQADLEAALAAAPVPKELPVPECQFLSSGPWARAGEESFRETDEFTKQAILPGDILEYLRLRRNQNEAWKAEGLVVPVPRQFAKSDASGQLPSFLHIAEGGQYSKALGYLDEARAFAIV